MLYKYNLYELQSPSHLSVKSAYTILAEILLQPQYANDIVKYFREELLHVLYIAIPINEAPCIADCDQHIINSIILAKIITLHPDSAR